MSETNISANQTTSAEIYEKITEYVNQKNNNYEILEYYLNSNLINKDTQVNILTDIFKSKDLPNKYHTPLNPNSLPKNPYNSMKNVKDYQPTFSETKKHSYGFIEPQVKYSYCVYLLNEIAKLDEYYYLAFYELGKVLKFDNKLIFKYDILTNRLLKSFAKLFLYSDYSTNPKALSWRLWMTCFEDSLNKIDYHTYSVFDFAYHLAETYSYEIPIVFEEVEVYFANIFAKSIFGVDPIEKITPDSNLSFMEYFDIIKKSNPDLSEEKLNQIRQLCFDYEITKEPKIEFRELYEEENFLDDTTWLTLSTKFCDCLNNKKFSLCHIIYKLCRCLELIRTSPEKDCLLDLVKK